MSRRKWMAAGAVALGLAGVAAGVAWMRPGTPPASGTALAATGAAAVTGAKAATDAKAPPPLEFSAREVVQPTRQRLPQTLAFSGALVAPQTAVLRARAAGTLLTLAVAEGERVRAGQVLGRLDLADLASRAEERAAQVASARTALAQAERSHAGNQRLAAQGFISEIALVNSLAAVDTAQAALRAAQAALGTTQVALRDAALVAPIAGIVSRRHALPGEKVSAEQPLLTLVDLQRLELAAHVGTHEVARLAPGMAVQVQVEGVAEPLTATLSRIAPAAEPGTRAIGVTVALPNPGERLRAGQYALARVVLEDPLERLVLPASAVLASGGEPYVWAIENGALARRSVTLGRRDASNGLVEIAAGLGADSQVLGARFDNLREGALARVLPDKAAALAEAGAPAPAGPAAAPLLR
jgi:RND family efflux transporter MFP subunit